MLMTANMPSLRELELKPFYSRNTCEDIVGEFFVPVLKSSVSYDRTTYTFSARAFITAARGIAGLVDNDGRMRLICDNKLPEDVVDAISKGLVKAEDAVLDSIPGRSILADASENPEDRRHLELLTWLVKEGLLDIKVAIVRQREIGDFHQKIALMYDAHGNRVGLQASLNESVRGWLYNDESMSVFNSWKTPEHVEPLEHEFDLLWNNKAVGSQVIPLPEALERELIEYAPQEHTLRKSKKDYREELWAAVEHAISNDPQTTIETVAAELWPHQSSFWRRYARDVDKPPRVLIADEVGLGKTIQAGALLKTFINRGQAERILILTPATSRWQWQEELRLKFNIQVPVLDREGSVLKLKKRQDDEGTPCSSRPWQDSQHIIMSYDWLRRNAKEFFFDDPHYDIVVFDEAHRARYSDVANAIRRSPNSYLRMLQQLSKHTQGLLLLTATPMQIHPVELWGLLEVLIPDSGWSESEFQRFYDSSSPNTFDEWDCARELWLRGGMPGTPEQIAELARMPLDRVNSYLEYIQSENPVTLKRNLTEERIEESLVLMRRSSVVKRAVSRHTRELLRQYAREGRLSQSVPQRDARTVVIRMSTAEREIYDEIPKLVRACYAQQEGMNRPALGFVMTGFRTRLGSSVAAFEASLMSLKDRRSTEEAASWAELIDTESDDLGFDPDQQVPALPLEPEYMVKLDSLIGKCRRLGRADSKFAEFLRQVRQLRSEGHRKIMVFSQFWDTQEWLRSRLARQEGISYLAGLSGNNDWRYDPSSGAFMGSSRQEVMADARERLDCLLLCTDSASESLNFQFCSAVINYDIPWNPMRLEQRIGRIDRIGQEKEVIRIANLFYHDTVEYDAYEAMKDRIDSFEKNVGGLQPILGTNLERIIRNSLVDAVIDGHIENSRSIVDDVNAIPDTSSFDLDDLAAAASDEDNARPLLYRNDLSYILGRPRCMPEGYSVVPSGRNHWWVKTDDKNEGAVTTSRQSHEYGAGQVEFFGPGSELFPKQTSPKDGIEHRPIAEIIPDMLR